VDGVRHAAWSAEPVAALTSAEVFAHLAREAGDAASAPLRSVGLDPAPGAEWSQETDERSSFALELGGRLRAVRRRQSLSLQAVEQRSQGRYKAVVVGSYERGDRTVTVQRLCELARFYGVPVIELIPDGSPSRAGARIILDLERLDLVPRSQALPLVRYAAAIQAQRGDARDPVLPIREEDLRALAVIYDASPQALVEQLIAWGVLTSDARDALG